MATSSLHRSYAIIGQALLEYEQQSKSSSHNFAYTELRESLVFTAVEILESYLEDLLNINFSEENLYIAPRAGILNNLRIGILVLTLTLLAGSTALLLGSSLYAAIVTALICSLPLIIIFSFAPLSMKRRLSFARALSKEIARRRGQDDDTGKSSIAYRDFFIKQTSQGLPGAARYRFH